MESKKMNFKTQMSISLFILIFSISFAKTPSIGYDCHFTSESIVIDGNLDEAAWGTAAPIAFFVPVTRATPKTSAEGKLLWNDQYLFFCVKAVDEDLKATHAERDSATWRDDVLEIFLQPLPDSPIYYNLEINALGTVYDAENELLTAGPGEEPPRRRMKSDTRWDCPGLKHAVKTHGTIGDDSDHDKYWTLEAAIPFAALVNNSRQRLNSVWAFHLARYDYSRYIEDGKELSSTAPLSAVNFHKTEDFVPLRFAK
jgi:hypothetical protein